MLLLIEIKLKLNNVLSEVKISVIDTENEVSGTLWLMKKVLDKKVEQSTTSYYLDQELSSETYDFAYRDGNKLFVVHYTNNGENYFITEESLDQIDKALRWFIFCKSDNCIECTKNGTFWNAGCDPCMDPNGKCIKEQSTAATTVVGGIFAVIVAVIGLF